MSRSHSLALFALGNLLALVATPPAMAQSSSMQVVREVQKASPGRLRFVLEINDPRLDRRIGRAPDPSDFRINLKSGKAKLEKAERLRDAGIQTHTLLAVDQSGSFRRRIRKLGIEQAVRSVLSEPNRLHAGSTASVMGFGFLDQPGAVLSSSKDLAREMDKAWRSSPRPLTFIAGDLEDTVQRLGTSQQALTQIIIITDALDEGVHSGRGPYDSVIAAARKYNIRFHLLVVKPGRTNSAFRAHLGALRDLARETGGSSALYRDNATMKALLAKWWEAPSNYLVLEASVCGLDGSTRNTFSVDFAPGGTAGGSTATEQLVDPPDPAVYASCDPVPAQAQTTPTPTPTPASPECARDADCPGALCRDGACESASEPPMDWAQLKAWGIPALAVLLALLGSLLLWRLFRAKRSEEPVAAAARPPEPTLEPDIPPPPVQVPTVPRVTPRKSPPTYLQGIEEWGQIHRLINRNPFRVGGAEAFDLQGQSTPNHLVIDQEHVSSRHLTIEVQEDGWIWLTDHSRNGTFVDGRRLEREARTRVLPHAQIRLGGQVLLVVYRQQGFASVAPPAPAPAPAPESAGPRRKPRVAPSNDHPRSRPGAPTELGD